MPKNITQPLNRQQFSRKVKSIPMNIKLNSAYSRTKISNNPIKTDTNTDQNTKTRNKCKACFYKRIPCLSDPSLENDVCLLCQQQGTFCVPYKYPSSKRKDDLSIFESVYSPEMDTLVQNDLPLPDSELLDAINLYAMDKVEPLCFDASVLLALGMLVQELLHT